MKNKKLCCRIFPIVLIVISALLSAGANYFDEGVHEFTFISNRDEFFNFLGTTLFVALVPIALFYYLVEKEKYETRARQLALLGFLPALVILLISIF